MSYFDYVVSRRVAVMDAPFHSLIMAAYRQADTRNAALIRDAWPDVVAELEARYNAPGGTLDTDAAAVTP